MKRLHALVRNRVPPASYPMDNESSTLARTHVAGRRSIPLLFQNDSIPSICVLGANFFDWCLSLYIKAPLVPRPSVFAASQNDRRAPFILLVPLCSDCSSSSVLFGTVPASCLTSAIFPGFHCRLEEGRLLSFPR